MPLNITVHALVAPQYGSIPPAADIDENAAAQVVALGAISTAITGPCTLCLIADEGERISVSRSNVFAAPAASGIKLLPNVERWYNIKRTGPFYINAIAG